MSGTRGGHVRVEGKRRKQRAAPLTAEARAVLTVWLAERGGQQMIRCSPGTGRRLSRDAVEHHVAYRHRAMRVALKGERIHPHVLRHSCAMSRLQAGVDTSVIVG